MSTIHNEICPVCSNHELKEMFVCRDFLVTKEEFSLYRCRKCGFALTQDFPSEDGIGRYYEAPEYISHTDTHQGIINRLYHQARKISLQSKVKLIEKYIPHQTGRLLDVGCGTGYFLNAMSERKEWALKGIEKSPTTREYARKKFDLNISDTNFISEIPPLTEDAITLWHVLEHIENLNSTMQHLHRILKDDGTLFIALPNKNSFDAAHYQNMWAAYDVPRHLWHFSPDDFTEFAEKHNFKVVEMLSMKFDPFYISMLSEKNRGTFLASLVGLTKGCCFFFRSLFNLKRGSSIIYILKKK